MPYFHHGFPVEHKAGAYYFPQLLLRDARDAQSQVGDIFGPKDSGHSPLTISLSD